MSEHFDWVCKYRIFYDVLSIDDRASQKGFDDENCVWAGSDIKSIDQRILSVTQKKIDKPSHLSLKCTNFLFDFECKARPKLI